MISWYQDSEEPTALHLPHSVSEQPSILPVWSHIPAGEGRGSYVSGDFRSVPNVYIS